MELIKGNKALAKEMGVCQKTVHNWMRKGLIKPKRRILKTIYWDINEVLTESKKRR